jgi:hypothetical protein
MCTNTAAALLADLRHRGFYLAPGDNDYLLCTPASLLGADDKAAIRRNKTGLLEILRRERAENGNRRQQ